MHTRVITSGGPSYLQPVEGHRAEQGKVRIKFVANLGRLYKLTAEVIASHDATIAHLRAHGNLLSGGEH